MVVPLAIPRRGLFIGGGWREPSLGRRLPVVNHSTRPRRQSLVTARRPRQRTSNSPSRRRGLRSRATVGATGRAYQGPCVPSTAKVLAFALP
ncbi:hypothetical protein GUJ93_ZPchr0004g38151 [Zizania palustris]|uniref:Uncharacterized protein n=1 Tax=Zizania palustris TaxID=103762 RepID=A0A8J5SJ12_ZIZPA|nr:hypothetical protein GUJ93_ZPchr0004g38151 [Zizania palustris]